MSYSSTLGRQLTVGSQACRSASLGLKSPHLDGEETGQTVPSPPSHSRVDKCSLTYHVKNAFTTAADLASIVAPPSLPSVC